jgi:hypothetical protein
VFVAQKQVYPIDRLLRQRYKSLILRHLNEFKALESDSEAKSRHAILERFRSEFYQEIDSDQQVFLKRVSVQAFLDRYISKMLTP